MPAGEGGPSLRTPRFAWARPSSNLLTPAARARCSALFEAPDDAAAAAVEIADVALGHLRSNRLLRVLSAEEMHAALQQAASAPNIAPKLAG